MKKCILSALLILCMMMLLPQNVLAASVSTLESSAPDVVTASGYKHSGSLEMSKLSKAEILSLLETNSLALPSEMFEVAPSCAAPYSPGKVKDEVILVAVNRLNALRRIAGLPAVEADSTLNENAQYGAVLLATEGVTFSHYPAQPSDMEDAFYEKALAATSSSNIYGGVSLSYSVDGFMDDSDSSNVDRLGHRRWQLNPTMGKIGFGYAENANARYRRYVTEKVFDRSGAGCEYDFISWPASGNFPSSQFEEHVAWSITLNPTKYETPVEADITVVLSRESDGAVWTFRGSNTYTASYSGEFFNVDTAGYGVSNCIIFRPDGIEVYDGVYTVQVYGLKDKSGNAVDFAYKVDFFDEADATSIALTESMFIVDTSAEMYNGNAKTKVITTTLTENVDYVVTYSNNVNAGTATMYISGMGNYTGVITKTFTIEKAARSLSAYASPSTLFVYGLTGNVYISADNASQEGPRYRYMSSNATVATVDAGGGIVPVGEGAATITIVADETSNYLAGSTTVKVTVKCPTITISDALHGSITVDAQKAYIGQYVTFQAVPDEGYWLSAVSVTDTNGNKLTVAENSDGSHSFYMPMSDVTIWATFKVVIPEHTCAIAHYRDVDLEEWYHFALDYVVSQEMMKGTSEDSFEPYSQLTRAMLAQILYNKEDTPEMEECDIFTDVVAGEWYVDAVNWAASVEIVSGYPEGTFAPNQSITREQVALILCHYAEYKGYDISARGDLAKFTDGNATHNWARDAMEWAIGAGLMSGKSDTRLDPTATATRAEVAQILKNFNSTVEK